MKFTIVAVIAALCLVAVNANATVEKDNFPVQDEVDLQYTAADLAEDETMEIATFGNIFSGMYWTLKAVLRTLKGINCTIKGVFDIKTAAQKFIDDVNACGGVVSKQVQSVITACKNVISTANAIITLNDNACKNGDYNDETDGTSKTPYFSCFVKMLGKMMTLKRQIQKVINLIQKVPDAGVGAGVCVRNALTDLQTVFVQFPAMVKTCSKLTS